MTRIVSTAGEAVSSIPDGSRIVVPPGPARPQSLLEALGERQWRLGIDLYCSAAKLPESVVHNTSIRIIDWQLAGQARSLHESGRVEYVPLRYSDFSVAFGRGGPLQADVLLLQIPEPAETGALSPGLSGALGFDIIDEAPLVVAEFNRSLPFTHSPDPPGIESVDVAIVNDEVLTRPPATTLAAAELDVARKVVELIPDGATLQFGTGGVVDATLGFLRHHRDLGIHSGMVTDGVLPLLKGGVITNARKGCFDGQTVAGMVFGDREFLEFINDNPEFLVVPSSVSHGLNYTLRLRNFVAINSAVEVDLSGQVNAEAVRGRQFSGVGGQADYSFASASMWREGGRAIIALPSTGASGSVSRIVPRLTEGAVVTTPRYCVDFVVTEHGIADLRFKTLRERADQLIRVASPTYREELERAAADAGF